MSLKNYMIINNYTGLGTLAISRTALTTIVEKSIKSMEGAVLTEKKKKRVPSPLDRFSLNDPAKVVFTAEGKLLIKLNVSIFAGNNVSDTCLNIQKEISNNLLYMCDTIPCEIKVHVDKII
ncbi:MAG: Asp23/Gls24 family envelope stress response protein [Bacilli bacterium]|nr:Asp23/Gls24 family envelope stress response protein [Bacilli bacterium]MDY6430651.1 Asp23/Gls24 family envelope stress response protein [Bacilli bacterium]